MKKNESKKNTKILLLLTFWVVIIDSSIAQSIIKTFNDSPRAAISNEFIEYQGKLIFFVKQNNKNAEMWETDGAEVSTKMICELPQRLTAQRENASKLTVFMDKIYFSYNDNIHGPAIWRTDGTKDGTELFNDVNPELKGGYPSNFAVFKNRLYFAFDHPEYGLETWYTDGTIKGTKLLLDLNPGPQDGGSISKQINDNYYFMHFGNGFAEGAEIWVSDGTKKGTNLLKDCNVGSANSCPSWRLESNLRDESFKYFYSHDDKCESINALWMTNGNPNQTTKVLNLAELFPGKRLTRINVINNHVLIYSYEPPNSEFRYQLYSISIENPLPKLIRNTNTLPQNFTLFNDRLYWVDVDSLHGYEPWYSDGTVEGTAIFKDLSVGTANSGFKTVHSGYHNGDPLIANNKLYFTTGSKVNNTDLWETDGSPTETNIILKSNTFENGFRPERYYSFGNYLLIIGSDNEYNKLIVTLPIQD